jgi:hypothetical protein
VLSAYYDEVAGVACTRTDSLATIDEFEIYLPVVTKLLRRSHARHGAALHLVDASENPIQAQDVFAHMSSATVSMRDMNICCAIVLHSTLARLQIQRLVDTADRRFFTDKAAAANWIMAQARALSRGACAPRKELEAPL